GPGEGRIDVVDVHVEHDRRAAEAAGAADAHLRELVLELVGQHDQPGADGELGVADPAVRLAHAHALGGTEHAPGEADGGRRSVDAQVGGHLRVVVGDRGHVAHGPSVGVRPAGVPRSRRFAGMARTDPDLVADELTMLTQYLDYHRATLAAKAGG